MGSIQKETEEKIVELQLLEQNLQNFLLQKQKFQTEFIEIENALKELESDQKETYKIISNIMVAAKKPELKKELESRKNIINLRIKNLEKQEGDIKMRMNELQKEVMAKLNPSK